MSRTLPRRVVSLLVLAFFVCAASLVVAQMKMAVVDTQRAAMETEDGLRATATLKKLFDRRQQELDRRQNEMQKEREDIEKQRGVLSQEAFNARVEKWQREALEIQNMFVEYNKELQKKQAEVMQPILAKTMGIIRRIATQNGYDLVVEKQAVPYFRSDLDLTDRVITTYNGGAVVETPTSSKSPAPVPTSLTPPTLPAAKPAP